MPAKRAQSPIRVAGLVALLALAACQRDAQEAELADLDNQIVGNDADPALTSALEDQIMVDPALTQQSNKNAVRPPEMPTQAQYPVGEGSPAKAQPARTAAPEATQAAAAQPGTPPIQRRRVAAAPATEDAQAEAMAGLRHGRGSACGAELDYDISWAARLPAGFGVVPGGRVTQAAGNDTGDCRVRVVTFTSNAAPGRVLGWYRQRATNAGYSAEHQRREGDHILAGINSDDDGAYYLIVTPLRQGGSEVALIANNGR